MYLSKKKKVVKRRKILSGKFSVFLFWRLGWISFNCLHCTHDNSKKFWRYKYIYKQRKGS